MSVQAEYRTLSAELTNLLATDPDSDRVPEIEARLEELAQEAGREFPPCCEDGDCGHYTSTMDADEMNAASRHRRKSA